MAAVTGARLTSPRSRLANDGTTLQNFADLVGGAHYDRLAGEEIKSHATLSMSASASKGLFDILVRKPIEFHRNDGRGPASAST